MQKLFTIVFVLFLSSAVSAEIGTKEKDSFRIGKQCFLAGIPFSQVTNIVVVEKPNAVEVTAVQIEKRCIQLGYICESLKKSLANPSPELFNALGRGSQSNLLSKNPPEGINVYCIPSEICLFFIKSYPEVGKKIASYNSAIRNGNNNGALSILNSLILSMSE